MRSKLTWKTGRAICRSYSRNEWTIWVDGFKMARDDFMYRHGRALDCGCHKFWFWFAAYRMGCPENHGGLDWLSAEDKTETLRCPSCLGESLVVRITQADCSNCGHRIEGFKGF